MGRENWTSAGRIRKRLAEMRQGGLRPVDRARHFVNDTIWDEANAARRWQRFLYPKLRVLVLAVWNFNAHGAPTHAAALTYTSLLAVVPVLAVALSLFVVFGGMQDTQERLLSFLVEYLAPGQEKTLRSKLDEFVVATRGAGGTTSIVATVLLFATVIRTLAGLEGTFNVIAGAKRGRSWAARIPVYWALVTLGPVLLGASLAMTAALQTKFHEWLATHASYLLPVYQYAPALLTGLAFAMLYLFLPNVKIKPDAALAGGLVAGIAFEVAKRLFTRASTDLVTKYSQIYGPIATVFVFLLWMYISWMILLIGLEIVVAAQSATSHRKEEISQQVPFQFRELIALRLMTEVCARFQRGEPPPVLEKLARALDLPERILDDVLGILEDRDLVRAVEEAGDLRGYVPARAIESITANDVLKALLEDGAAGLTLKDDEHARAVRDLFGLQQAALAEALGDADFKSIVDRLSGAPAPGPAPAPAAPPAALAPAAG